MAQEREEISMGAMHVNLYDANESGPINVNAFNGISMARSIEVAKTILEKQLSTEKVPDEFQVDWNNLGKKALNTIENLYDSSKKMDTLCKKRDAIRDNERKACELKSAIGKLRSQVDQEQEELEKLFKALKKN